MMGGVKSQMNGMDILRIVGLVARASGAESRGVDCRIRRMEDVIIEI